MPKFIVTSPLLHDGTSHEIDAEIELSAKAARQLLEVGAVREIAAIADKKKKPAAEGDGDNK